MPQFEERRDLAEPDPSSYPGTDGTNEGAERALANVSQEEILAFVQAQADAQTFRAVGPLLARLQESEERSKGGVLGRSNTARRENGSQIAFAGGDGSGSARTTDLKKRLVQISGDAGEQPRILAVSLSKVVPVRSQLSNILPLNHLIWAEIKWGSGKAKNAVVIDYKQGQRVTVDGSYVEVNGIYSSSAFPSPLLGPDVILGAQVIEGSLGIPSNGATFTSGRYAVFATTFTPSIPVPSFSNTVSIASIGAGPFTLEMNTGDAAPVSGIPASTQTMSLSTPVGIPNGIESIRVKNGGAAADSITVTFGLNF